ncbi:MAG: ribonuclease P protein component [Planctomycetes bacterium]|nr:ribonuclease P protein component [Planctomycetota bacterium]
MSPRLRFPRHFRIRSGADFGRAYRNGRRARGSILLVVGADSGRDHPRLGLSVGKKVWKHAVKRNRVRRVFREAFRLTAPELPNLDLVLIPAEPRLVPTTAETARELRKLARKVARRLEEARTAAPDDQAPKEPPAAPGPRKPTP